METSRLAHSHLRYLIALTGFVALSLASIITVNLLVDPLWYFSGTRIGTRNYEFNLRTSKINLIRDNPGAYDCLIFGASVITLLDASAIQGYRCFNAAVNGATAEDLAAYARYFKEMGVHPRLVIVGLDPVDLGSARTARPQMPDFVMRGGAPEPVLWAYASADVFWFSIRSTLGLVRHSRWFTEEFVCRLTQQDPMTPSDMLRQSHSYEDFGRESLAAYAELLNNWPQAHTIGYVPFVNAWVVEDWRQNGLLEGYLETIRAFSGLFDELYDFSAPSDITMDLTQTNDGLHYSKAANDLIAAQVSGDRLPLGLAVHEHSYEEFKNLYLERVEDMPSEIVRYVRSHSR